MLPAEYEQRQSQDGPTARTDDPGDNSHPTVQCERQLTIMHTLNICRYRLPLRQL